jgi:phospholipid/cholesterol/gamma-HCH transport system ATP-binding protein
MNTLASGVPLLEATGLWLSFDGHPVLTGVDLVVPRAQVIAILGKSGVGKSVLLKCLAGLLQPEAGTIRFAGRELAGGYHADRAEFRRRCSYLFQDNALLDSLTAMQNVALPLEQTTAMTDREIRRRAGEALALFELESFSDLYPGQLSGGQQKRLALARAAVTKPELVLFDEPTAGLDPIRRNAVFALIAQVQRRIGFTAVLVTHDVPEALVTCDTIALLDDGQIRFYGPSAEFTASTDSRISAFRDSVGALAGIVGTLRRDATVSDLR